MSRTDEPGPRLSADNVSKTIGKVQLLAPTSLEVAPGTTTVIRGENGSGKTTLLRILAGLIEPTTGTATINDRPVDERDPASRRTIAALIGAPTAYRDLTLADHLILIDATWGRDVDTTDERVDAQLDALGIGHLHDRFPHELSSGQRQLFTLGLTLFRPSRLLILDEPEQRLDPIKRGVVSDLINARSLDGTTVVMACHDPTMTSAVASNVHDVHPAAD